MKFKKIYRLNTDNRWVTYHYAVCWPSNTDLSVSSTNKYFEELARGYGGTWERASNMVFMVPENATLPGVPYSYVYRNGQQVYPVLAEGNVVVERAWAMSLVTNSGSARVVEATPSPGAATASNDSALKMGSTLLNQCKWAASVGPLPIGGAPLSEHNERDYPDPTGNDDYDRFHVGLGLLPNGMFLHLANIDGYCSKEDITKVAKEFGPNWFQIFDGGGSVGMIDKNDGNRLFGFSDRPMRVAFMINRTEEIPAQYIKQDCIIPPGYTGPTPC